jgi:KTSC domain
MPKMEPHKSEMTTHHGFDANEGGLHLTFKNGGSTYSYPIPEDLYNEYLAADSKGQFFHKRIKPHFTGTKV